MLCYNRNVPSAPGNSCYPLKKKGKFIGGKVECWTFLKNNFTNGTMKQLNIYLRIHCIHELVKIADQSLIIYNFMDETVILSDRRLFFLFDRRLLRAQ